MKKNDSQTIAQRKDHHLAICLQDQVEFYGNGFENWRFDHDALTEVDLNKIDLQCGLLNKTLAAPLIIGAMTGGTEQAKTINQRLAQAAEICQVGLALGSQRKMLVDSTTHDSFQVRKYAANLPLLWANLGAVQVNYQVDAAAINQLIDLVEADAINFHFNPLQEAIQPEGDVNFENLFTKLQETIPLLKVDAFAKEVGSGISASTAKKFARLPFKGVETAGLGGTSWSKIESLRAANPAQKSLGELFAQWGVPTAESIINCKTHLRPDQIIIASGGLRNGIELAKALVLGADAGAMAMPFLKAANQSVDAVVAAIEQVKLELKTTLFLVGARNLSELKTKALTQKRDYTAL